MRVATTSRALKRTGGHLPHRLDRQQFKTGHRSNARGRGARTDSHVGRRWRGGSVGQCLRSVVPMPLALKLSNSHAPFAHDAEDSGLQNTWYAVEDLWRRLNSLCPVTVTTVGDSLEVSFANVRASEWDDATLKLICHVQNMDCYRWRQEGRTGDIVQFIEFRGDDLVIETTPLRQMERWALADSFACQLKGLLHHLGHRSAP